MSDIIKLSPVVAGQYLLPFQLLTRTPEPDAVMAGDENVSDFDSIMNTNVSISLCGMVDLIGRLGFGKSARVAIDLACGPGHFTLMLAEHLDFDHVIGVDLSKQMLDRAIQNASKAGLSDRTSFIYGDATDLSSFDDNSVDLITCTNSAHHLPDLEGLGKMLREMDRVATSDGLCAIMDLTRLKTAWTTKQYVNTMGKEYVDSGLFSLFADFENSMYAAWTSKEMCSACPIDSGRDWHHFAISPIPINQFMFSKTSSHGDDFSLNEFHWKCGVPPLGKQYSRAYHQYNQLKLHSLQRNVHRVNQ